jgi:predicted NUDIX family NTP pyrophosphohydrolase
MCSRRELAVGGICNVTLGSLLGTSSVATYQEVQVYFDTPVSKMPKRSAGLMMFRKSNHELEVFLVHPGGPLWARKDIGAWTIPKGEYEQDESPLAAARREFEEETGFQATGQFLDLGVIKQKSGKVVTAWAFEGDCDPADLTSNTCEIQWPPRSWYSLEIPEVDRGRWFSIEEAQKYIREEQRPLLDKLCALPQFGSD